MDRRYFSTPVDQERRWQGVDAAIHFRGAVVTDDYAVVYPEVCQEGLDYLPALIVHGNAQNFETLVLILTLHVHEPGDFDLARPAPGCPEVEENDFSLVIGKMH